MSESMQFIVDNDESLYVKKVRTAPTGPRGPRARSDEQQVWDRGVKAAFDTSGVFSVQIAPELATEARKRVASAFRILEIAGTEGEPRPGRVDGTVILAWKLRVPVPKGPRNAPQMMDTDPDDE